MPSLSELMRAVAPAREHGGIVAAELAALGIDAASVLDVSTSVNPYGPAPVLEQAVRAAVLESYPDPTAAPARAALARACATTADRVVVGNGATELLWTLARVLLAPGETLLVCEPAFSELRVAAVHAGARVAEWRAGAAQDFALDLPAIARRAGAAGARVVALCVPASPSGAAVAVAEVAALAAELGDAVLVLDQSFLALSERYHERTIVLPGNVVCVRSLTKEHGIPGVRVGYLLAAARLAAVVEASRPAWTVGASAQAAAIAACTAAAEAFVAASRARLLDECATLAAAIAALGFRILPSTVPFFLVEVADAAALRRRLLAGHGILVRDCTSFGMPGHVRIAARGGRAAQRIVAAFADCADWASAARREACS